MATSSKIAAPARLQRSPLNRERIIAEALELLDHEGAESVTMRRLATELGVVATAIHWHVKTREEVLRGVIDLVYDDIELPEVEDLGWDEAARSVCRSIRTQLVAHPNVMTLLSLASPASTVRVFSAVLQAMLQSGLDPSAAVKASQLLVSFTAGTVLSGTLIAISSSGDRLLGDLASAWVRANGFDALDLLPRALDFQGEDLFEQGITHMMDGLRLSAGAR